MSAEEVECWLSSGRNALINRISLKPIEHGLRKGKPLSSQKGQAEAFFLVDDNGSWWILKKFHVNCKLDSRYLKKVSALLPKTDGFLCGTRRHVLSQGALWKAGGYHFNKDLDRWLDGTILMPRIVGLDWAGFADKIRADNIRLLPDQRFSICRNLTQLIELLESIQCCHRDLSCGNVFINPTTFEVCLIDFDSLYHPSLSMPAATTCGTMGYTAHHAWNRGQMDVTKTWCPYADRYALSLLNTEFLLVEHGSDVTGDGGLFDQDELKNQGGKRFTSLLQRLHKKHPRGAELLESTIRSNSFKDCPSPVEWHQFIDGQIGPAIQPPRLQDLVCIDFKKMASKLAQQRQAGPLWPAPSLAQLPEKTLNIPRKISFNYPHVSLPSDPWCNKSQTVKLY